MRLMALIALFLQWVKDNRKPRTWEFYRDQLTRWATEVGDKWLEELHPMDLMMSGHKWHLWVAVQRLCNWATYRAKLMTANPFKAIEKPRLGRRNRTLSPAEQVQVLRASAWDMRELLIGGRETGARPQEARALQFEWLLVEDPKADYWPQVFTGHGFFLLDHYKAQDRRDDDGPPRILPVSPRFGRLLFRIACRGNGTGVIFKTAGGREWTKDAIVCRMRRLRAKLQLPAKRKSDQVCFYTLRHTTITGWFADGLASKIAQELAGHRDLRMTQRYSHIERYRQLAAIREIWQRRRRG